jgi:hypothetical protein
MARITPSQPNDAMARIASRRNRTISLDPNLPGKISERFFRDSSDVNLRFSSKKKPRTTQSPEAAIVFLPPRPFVTSPASLPRFFVLVVAAALSLMRPGGRNFVNRLCFTVENNYVAIRKHFYENKLRRNS